MSAELAVTLPAVLSLCALVFGALGLTADQAKLTSAAGWASRAIAIGGDEQELLRAVSLGITDVEATVTVVDGLVCVTLVRKAPGPLAALPIAAIGHSCVRQVL